MFHLREVVFFGIIGVLATLTHYLVAVGLVEQLGVSVYWANIGAYCVAVLVSFIGHSLVTFKKTITKSRAIRFFLVSVSALALSQLVLLLLQKFEHMGPRLEFLVVVMFIPTYSYLLNKFWVYKH